MDPEAGRAYSDVDVMSAFSEKSIRLGFIRKVYGILSIQLGITAGIVGIFTTEKVRSYTEAHSAMFWVAFALSIGTLIGLACCGNIRRKSPHNLILLGIFTLAQGFLLGTATAVYNAKEVLLAIGITVLLVFALTAFAFQTKIDFTACAGILMVALLCLVLFGFFAVFLPHSKTLNIVYASIGAFIFSVYIIFDTQMMMGGTHKYAISPEEYIFASLNLYLDVINLFLMLLSIIGNSNR